MNDESLVPRSSSRNSEWREALTLDDDALLADLARNDEPGCALLEMESYVNGLYHGSSIDLGLPKVDARTIRAQVARVQPHIDGTRNRIGWRVREFDLCLLRLMRQSSVLSPVLGAGASMAAGAPSWPQLVKLLLEETIENGLALREPVPPPDGAEPPPIDLLPDGSVRLTSGKAPFKFETRVSEVKRYRGEQEAVATRVLKEIHEHGEETDVDTLTRGAQVCHDLCGQHLFQLLTAKIYSRAKAPSEIHRAIAELAHPVRGEFVVMPRPGVRTAHDSDCAT